MPTTYRIATPADIPALMSIRNAVRENRLVSLVLTDEDYTQAMTTDGRAWLCEVDGEVVGFSCGRPDPGDVWALFVRESHEGVGIGTRLLGLVEDWMFAEGVEHVWLVTEPGTRAERLYRWRGWSKHGDKHTGEAEYRLTRAAWSLRRRAGTLYDVPRLYDTLMGEPPSDEALRFIDGLVAAHGGRVLDLACGTGRYTIPVAQRGHAITGVDCSEPMLARARERSSTAGVDVTWVCADMRDFSLDARFGLVMVPSQSFQHLHTREDVERTLDCVRRHLAPGGVLFLELFVPSPAILARALEDGGPFTTSEPSYVDPESGSELTAWIRVAYDQAAQVITSTYHYKSDDERVAGSFDVTMRQFFPQEIDALLHYNGFEILAKYGDLDGTPFVDAPEYQHIVCRPRRG